MTYDLPWEPYRREEDARASDQACTRNAEHICFCPCPSSRGIGPSLAFRRFHRKAHASANGRERPRCTFDTNAWQISRGQEFVSEHPETARAVSRRRVAPMPSPLPHWLFATPLGVVSPSFRARDEKTDAHRENAADDHSAHRWDGTRGPNLWPPLRAQLLRTGSTRGGPTRARSRL